jgi:hypothetical protein
MSFKKVWQGMKNLLSGRTRKKIRVGGRKIAPRRTKAEKEGGWQR